MSKAQNPELDLVDKTVVETGWPSINYSFWSINEFWTCGLSENQIHPHFNMKI